MYFLQLTLKEKGWVIDGFPRTEEEATFLIDTGIVPDAVFLFTVGIYLCTGRIHLVDDPEKLQARANQRIENGEIGYPYDAMLDYFNENIELVKRVMTDK